MSCKTNIFHIALFSNGLKQRRTKCIFASSLTEQIINGTNWALYQCLKRNSFSCFMSDVNNVNRMYTLKIDWKEYLILQNLIYVNIKVLLPFEVNKDGWFRYFCRKYFDGFVTKYFWKQKLNSSWIFVYNLWEVAKTCSSAVV